MSAGAILVGSGPGLDLDELRALAGFPAIAFNRSFIAWSDWGFTPSYYACTHAATAALVVAETERLLSFRAVERFFLHTTFRADARARADGRVVFVEPSGEAFGIDGERIGDFGNVGATSLQLLIHCGHSRIVLMGTDARYKPRAGGPAINHFRPDYIPAGFSSRAPARIEDWPAAIAGARRNGAEIRLRTKGSALVEIAGLVEDTAPIDELRDWLGANPLP